MCCNNKLWAVYLIPHGLASWCHVQSTPHLIGREEWFHTQSSSQCFSSSSYNGRPTAQSPAYLCPLANLGLHPFLLLCTASTCVSVFPVHFNRSTFTFQAGFLDSFTGSSDLAVVVSVPGLRGLSGVLRYCSAQCPALWNLTAGEQKKSGKCHF